MDWGEAREFLENERLNKGRIESRQEDNRDQVLDDFVWKEVLISDGV